MIRLLRALLASAAMVACGSIDCHAAQKWQVRASPLLVMASTPAPDGAERVAQLGDVLLSSPLVIGELALPAEQRDIAIAGLLLTLRKDDILLPVRTSGGGSGELGEHTRVFCRGVEQPSPVDGTRIRRYAARVNICLVDSDADGRFEQIFLAGSKSEADWGLTPIAPLAYLRRQHEPVSGGALVLRYKKGAALQGEILALDYDIEGRDVGAATYIFGEGKSALTVEAERELRWKQFPNRYAFGSATVSVEGRDEARHSLRYRITSGFSELPILPEWALHTFYVYLP